MPHKTQWEEHGVHWIYYGTVTDQDAIKASREIYGDPRFDDLKYAIVDFLGTESISLTKKQAMDIAANDRAAGLLFG